MSVFCRGTLKNLSHEGHGVVRVHHDCDGSFEKEFSTYINAELIKNTNTGGYNPQNNSRVERRNRSTKQAFKAALLYATGGLPYYYSLWGPDIQFDIDSINKNNDGDGRNYHENLVGKKYVYDIGGRDLSFGQQVFYHEPSPNKETSWEPNGHEAIWVGRSEKIHGGHVVAPIKWDPNTLIYTLSPTKHVNTIRFENIKYPLKMGPTNNTEADATREANLDKYIDEFFLPWYKTHNPESFEDFQVEGEDPLWEVEAIVGKNGKNKKA